LNERRYRWSYQYRRGYDGKLLPPNEPDNPFALRDFWDGRNDRDYDDAAERERVPTPQPPPPVPHPVREPKPPKDPIGVGDFLIAAVIIPVLVALIAGGVAWYLDADVVRVALIAGAAALGLLVLGLWSDGTPALQWLIATAVALPVSVWLVLAWRGTVDWVPPHPW
jgi:hypothetical protein